MKSAITMRLDPDLEKLLARFCRQTGRTRSDDRWVCASAVEGRAEVFVTGDRDLLDVAGAASLKIVDPRGFWQLGRKS